MFLCKQNVSQKFLLSVPNHEIDMFLMNFRDVYYDWGAVIANLISVNNRDLNKTTSEKGVITLTSEHPLDESPAELNNYQRFSNNGKFNCHNHSSIRRLYAGSTECTFF